MNVQWWLIAILRSGLMDQLWAQHVNEGETYLSLCHPTVMAIIPVFMLIFHSKEWVTVWGQRPPTALLTEWVPLYEGQRGKEKHTEILENLIGKPLEAFVFNRELKWHKQSRCQSFGVKLVNLVHHTHSNFLHTFSVLSLHQTYDIHEKKVFWYKKVILILASGPSTSTHQQQDTGPRLEILFLGYPRGDGLIQANRITEILLDLFLSSISNPTLYETLDQIDPVTNESFLLNVYMKIYDFISLAPALIRYCDFYANLYVVSCVISVWITLYIPTYSVVIFQLKSFTIYV